MDTFGDRVKAMRHKANLTQSDLANMVGMTKQAISKIECGRTKLVTDEMIRRFSYYLKCTTDYLVGLSDDEYKNKKGLIVPISFDPQFEIKNKLANEFLKDIELVELFLQCNEKLNKSEMDMVKKMLRALIADK